MQLKNCRNQHYNDNAWHCRSAPMVGTVEGYSVRRFTNVYFYERYKKRTG